MRFLVDAQLPRRLASALNAGGHDAIHTLDPPERNASTDFQVERIADRDDRVVVTKDGDFRDSHLMTGRLRRVLRVATGNIDNTALLLLMSTHLADIVSAFDRASYVELTAEAMLVNPHRRSTSAGP